MAFFCLALATTQRRAVKSRLHMPMAVVVIVVVVIVVVAVIVVVIIVTAAYSYCLVKTPVTILDPTIPDKRHDESLAIAIHESSNHSPP